MKCQALVGFALGAHLCQDSFQNQAVKFPFIGSQANGTSVDDKL